MIDNPRSVCLTFKFCSDRIYGFEDIADTGPGQHGTGRLLVLSESSRPKAEQNAQTSERQGGDESVICAQSDVNSHKIHRYRGRLLLITAWLSLLC